MSTKTSRLIFWTGVVALVLGIVLMYFVRLIPFMYAFSIALVGAGICMFFFRRTAQFGQYKQISLFRLVLVLILNILVISLFGFLIYQNQTDSNFPLWVFAGFIAVLVLSSLAQIRRYLKGEEVRIR